MIRSVNIVQCTCDRCGKEFIPRTCPACKSPNWNKAETKPGRPRKIVASVHPDMEPIPTSTESVKEEVIVDLQPKTRRTAAKAKPKREERKATGKAEKCPHGFFIIDGITACRECKKSGA